ncbi:TetR/AcrR family transcriptional regulator [Paenibacillus guangzhouensis]|uniref:TetR/AcrR family transcriptional regulator n=1 Tax=Paenibacillus guangzhouensis TaxID=1473112 RepID=UPI00126731D8|nr:TetR/AcrR family transcriptional regulator [Paenibacillus guangzhouensis]
MEKQEIKDNKDKLLLAAIDLMADKGYKGVSTKEIAAAAGVSEMTLFRQFGSKQHLLEKAVDRYYYTVEMTKIFETQVVWELRTDLMLISRMYHESMNRNRKMIRIVLKEDELSEIRTKAQKHPRMLLELLTKYFLEMQKRGNLIPTDAEAQAMSFLWMNYGAFMSHLHGAEGMTNVTMERFIASSIELFTRGLTP